MVVCILVGLFGFCFCKIWSSIAPNPEWAMGFEESKKFLLWSWCHPFIPDAYRASVNGNTEPLRKVVNTKDSPGSGSWTLGDLGRFIFILSFSSYNGNRFITYLSPRPQPKLINVYVRASRGGSETFKERKTIWSFPTLADTYDPAGTYWSPRAVTILRNQLTINRVNHPGW